VQRQAEKINSMLDFSSKMQSRVRKNIDELGVNQRQAKRLAEKQQAKKQGAACGDADDDGGSTVEVRQHLGCTFARLCERMPWQPIRCETEQVERAV